LFSTNPIEGVSGASTLSELASKIAASGVKRIEGNLIGDESYFSDGPLQATWEWDDLQWKSGAEVSALSINDNVVNLQIAPGAQIGLPCVVTFSPPNQLFTVMNMTQTSASGAKQELEVHKRLGTNILELRGTMPLGAKAWSSDITVAKPAEMFAALLKNELANKGVVVTGQTRSIDAKMRLKAPLNTSALTELVRYESPLLGLIAAKTMKPSQNTYTELILRTLGESVGDKTNPKQTSSERGIAVVNKFLQENGIPAGSVVMWDGSGLSRHNLITPNAATQLYSQMNRHRFAAIWRESLTIGGTDGTLQNRFKNTLAAGNVRGKTGTIDQVSALSGYMTTASGERLAFSVIVNNLPGSSAAQRRVIDDIILLLANFNGKSN
jgi:D-alanyl-D-alanine carboxypeptidase/D-alanyl-D-alanine-endopeptidase (penicillin-binding protein 4)